MLAPYRDFSQAFMISRWVSKEAIKQNWPGVAFCTLVTVGPYGSLIFGPSHAGHWQRLLAVLAACVIDGSLLAGIRLVMLPSWSKGRSQMAFAMLLIPALTFYFIVAFRIAYGGLILYSTMFPDLFMVTPPGSGVAALMGLGLVFTAYEFFLVGKVTR